MLKNAYTLSNMMDKSDAERFISYFKVRYEIVDEYLNESSRLLYAQ